MTSWESKPSSATQVKPLFQVGCGMRESLKAQLSVNKNMEAVRATMDRWMMAAEKLCETATHSFSSATFFTHTHKKKPIAQT